LHTTISLTLALLATTNFLQTVTQKNTPNLNQINTNNHNTSQQNSRSLTSKTESTPSQTHSYIIFCSMRIQRHNFWINFWIKFYEYIYCPQTNSYFVFPKLIFNKRNVKIWDIFHDNNDKNKHTNNNYLEL